MHVAKLKTVFWVLTIVSHEQRHRSCITSLMYSWRWAGRTSSKYTRSGKKNECLAAEAIGVETRLID